MIKACRSAANARGVVQIFGSKIADGCDQGHVVVRYNGNIIGVEYIRGAKS
jgi:hypothetical protein